ncbi:MAG: precorrin-3B C(17)-methyltransferase, partial [Phyllobacterium sp.]
MTLPLSIFVLSVRGFETARRIKAGIEDATIFGLEGRVDGADEGFANFGETIRDHYQRGNAIIALCAAGITIRSLAPLLGNKAGEPPVLAVADDGSAVV